MRFSRFCVKTILSVLIVLLMCCTATAFAAGDDPHAMSEQEKKRYLSYFRLQVVEYAEEEYAKRFLKSMDVSSDEQIAVSFSNASVVIADKDFTPVCTMKFDPGNDNPDAFRVRWVGEDVVSIWSAGSGVSCIVNIQGEVLDVIEEDGDAYESTVVQVNGNIYRLQFKNKRIRISASGWDQLARINEEGEETILFQSERNPILKQRLILSIVVALPGLIVLFIFWDVRRKRKSSKSPLK